MSALSFTNSISTFSIFDTKIDNLTMQEGIDIVINSDRKKDKKGSLVAYFVNAHSLNHSFKSWKFRKIINRSDFVFADGCGVRIAAKTKGIMVKDNVNGTDMLPLLCKKASEKEKSIFMLGSAPGVAKEASIRLNHNFPNLKIAGYHHGFIDMNDSTNIIETINNSGANILLVGMGTPLQEKWIDENSDRLNTDIAIAVGGLFDYYSNRIQRAPVFFRKNSIEWVWRLMQEPKNKFYRYVVGNPLFLLRISLCKLWGKL